MSIVTETHPDEFGIVRDVTLQNALGRSFDHSITKCVLLDSTAKDEVAKAKAMLTLKGGEEGQGDSGLRRKA